MRISPSPLTHFALCSLLAVSAISLAAQAPATPPPAQATPAAPPAASTATSTVTIKIKGIRNAKGKIGVVLYGSSEGFPLDPSSATARKLVDIDPKTMTATVVFEKLPQGAYAATVLHDENLVGKMEFDSQGIPLEGYGVSNNPDSSSGPPSFDDAKFKVDQPEVAIDISMVYWQ
jgi:uncharacterized protein (DUF2141 family)